MVGTIVANGRQARNYTDLAMRIICIGTDPAGLYLAILLKTRDPSRRVTIIDTGQPVRDGAAPHILTNPVKPELRLTNATVAELIAAQQVGTRGLLVDRDSETIFTPGQRYTFIGATTLATLLREAAARAGCEFSSDRVDLSKPHRLADLVVVADGANSALRDVLAADVEPSLRTGKTRIMVFSSDRAIAQPGLLFKRTAAGVIHGFLYPDGPASSRLVVEANPPALAHSGLDKASPEDCAAICTDLFAKQLGAAKLSAKRGWHAFVSVYNGSWTSDNCVLIGAAAYNAHPSIGLGVRSGLEDAEVLATLLDPSAGPAQALAKFEPARRPRAESLQRASEASQVWFEHTDRYIDMTLAQFAYSLLTRSMRLNHETMRGVAPELTDQVEAQIGAGQSAPSTRPPPPMFAPITVRDVRVPNRIVMSPMCMYNAEDGTVGDFHLVHYGSRAMGGAGLILTEMTDVSPEGRISPYCAGIYKPEHVSAWRRVVDFVHAKTEAKIGIQLGHAGRKGSEPRPWERNNKANWPHWQTLAPSSLPFTPDSATPRALERNDMDRLIAAYAQATRMADAAGFDWLELHFAHGYLLSTFISPLANQRTDHYGGCLANRLRFPMEVFEAVRADWPQHKPISVRVSASDWAEGGTTIDDAITIGRTLKNAGNDVLTVSTGGVTGQRPSAGRLFQATFSDQIRNALKITTINVGGMASHGDINTMIAAGRADMCALARGHLFDPYFTRHAAYQQGFEELAWPQEYARVSSLRMRDF